MPPPVYFIILSEPTNVDHFVQTRYNRLKKFKHAKKREKQMRNHKMKLADYLTSLLQDWAYLRSIVIQKRRREDGR